MIEREVLADGSVQLRAADCTFVFTRLRLGALLVTVEGYDDGTLGTAPLEEIGAEVQYGDLKINYVKVTPETRIPALLHDKIDLESPQVDAGDVKDSIKQALKRNAKVDAELLSVDTNAGTVTLSGVAGSWAEHDAAIAAAWAAPGVTEVADNIVVDY